MRHGTTKMYMGIDFFSLVYISLCLCTENDNCQIIRNDTYVPHCSPYSDLLVELGMM